METINNVAAAASKAIWGEQSVGQANETAGQEPISGVMGSGTVTDPYDQGNTDTSTTSATNNMSDITGSNTTSSTTPHPTTNNMSDITGSNTTSSTTPHPTSTTNPTSVLSEDIKAPNNPVNAASGGQPDPLRDTDKTGVVAGHTGNTTKATDNVPSESAANPGAVPASGSAPEVKQQGANKPTDAPKDPKQEADELMKKRDPNDHSGEPMKVHDGTELSVPDTQEARRDSKAGMPGGQEHGKEPKGTGEHWVKTSGLASDGGDFDATKPGAGREADRLLEEKGIKKSSANQGAPHNLGSDAGKEKEKVPLGEKIKTKLHIGHKDK